MVSVQFNPLLPDVRQDPYPLYHRLREEDPVHWSDLMEAWVLTRYDDVVRVLKDNSFSADRRRARNRFAEQFTQMQQEAAGPLAQANTMLSSDPPEHTRLRGLVSKAFTFRAIEGMRPTIESIVTELLDQVEGRERFDIIDDLGYPLPVIVIAQMLGVPPEDRAKFKRWSDDIVATLGGPFVPPDAVERGRAAAHELAEYFRDVIEQRRREPREDILSTLIAAEEQGQVLSEEELLATCILLLVAGNETTTNLIGNGMLALGQHPDQYELLRKDLSLVESAVEEFLRYDSPVQMTARVATEPTEIDGKTVEPGQLVFTVLAAANRDPAVFPDPDRFDITRGDHRHLAFGFGIHSCLGAQLARVEAQSAFKALVQRFPRLEVETAGVEWRPSFVLRGPAHVPVRVG